MPHWRQTRPLVPTCTTLKGKGYNNASNDIVKGHFWMPGGVVRTTRSAHARPDVVHTPAFFKNLIKCQIVLKLT